MKKLGYEIEREIQGIFNILQINGIADCCAPDMCRKIILLFFRTSNVWEIWGDKQMLSGKKKKKCSDSHSKIGERLLSG